MYVHQAVISAMYEAFFGDRGLTDEDLKKSIRETVPLSVTQAEQIRELREWAATRAVLATAREDREAAPSGAPAGPDGSLQSGVQGGRIVDFD